MNLAINIFQNLLPLYIIIGIAALINKKIAYFGDRPLKTQNVPVFLAEVYLLVIKL